MRQQLLSEPGTIIALRGKETDFDTRYDTFQKNILASDRITVPSQFVKNMYFSNGYDTSNFEVLPLGVTGKWNAKPPRLPTRPIQIAFIGTLVPSKGAHILLRAFRSVRSDVVQLKLFGRPDLDPAYAKKLHLMANGDQRISFQGGFAPEQQNAIFRDMDVLIIPSIVPESFSLVAREALLSGTPVLASKLGALTEIIEDQVNGFLFSPSDDEDLARLLQMIADNPDVLSRLDLPGPNTILTISEHIDTLEEMFKRSELI
jgi:glycosyltransferase involved in cell wall biosynthesis